MKNRGFTLIELLAVIVILAIIALIATPIILNIIDDTKESARLRSIEFYIDSVNKAIARKNLTTTIGDMACEIQSDGNLLCDDITINVDIDGEIPTSGTVIIEDGQIAKVEDLIMGDKAYEYSKGSGVEFQYEVGATYTVTFNSNGGSAVSSQTVTAGSKITRPENPTKTKNNFIEWQLNGVTYDFNGKVKNNITLVALWEEIPTYTLITGENFNKEIKKLVGDSSSSTQWTEDTKIEKVGFFSYGELPEGYTLDGLQALPSKIVSLTGETIKAYWDNASKNVYVYSTGEIAWNSDSKFMFQNLKSLNNINIPENVRTIGNNTFYGCSSLTSITIPNTVTSMGTGIFYGCTNLASVNLPSSISTIGSSVFRDCTSLTSITIPNNITSIGQYAFENSGLTSITIPRSVTIIESNAFHNCNSLASIAIPGTVTTIGSHAFSGCGNLSSITLNSGIKTIGTGAFNDTSITSLSIPASVTSIGNNNSNICRGCSSLETITVASSNSKYESRNSNSIIRKETNQILTGCKNTIIPSTVASIGSDAFSGILSLTSISIPSSVTSIGAMAFYRCENLATIELSEGLKYIEQNAFFGCGSLTSITIPASVIRIEYTSFDYCSLSSMEVDDANEVYTDMDSNIIATKSTKSIVKGCSNSTIPDGIVSIGQRAFMSVKNLTSITIPSSVTLISTNAFGSCQDLTSVTFEETTGWRICSSSSSCSNITPSNPTTNATFLKSTYKEKSWKKN